MGIVVAETWPSKGLLIQPLIFFAERKNPGPHHNLIFPQQVLYIQLLMKVFYAIVFLLTMTEPTTTESKLNCQNLMRKIQRENTCICG